MVMHAEGANRRTYVLLLYSCCKHVEVVYACMPVAIASLYKGACEIYKLDPEIIASPYGAMLNMLDRQALWQMHMRNTTKISN
jgi:hypothetical protein